MFKDYNKYLNASLKVYIFVLVIIFIMKLVGLDYFGLEVDNPAIVKINDICLKYKIDYIWYFISLFIQLHFFYKIVCNKKNIFLYSLSATILLSFSQMILSNFKYSGESYFLISTIILILIPIFIEKKFFIKKQIKYVLLITLYQFISALTRNITVIYDEWNFIIDTILNIDQLLLLIITYQVKEKKGGLICGQVVSFSSQKLTNLKNLQKKLQKNWRNFKKQDKVTKLTFIIYFILSLIWNIFTVITVIIMGILNDSLIECIFILTSFWLSKREFGKAFHLSSMIQCFIVSNLTYYVLNRITTPLGISILIPIMLGVGLAYVTSKLVKETYKPLYKGMPEEIFENTILKVVEKDSHKYKICYDFYINGKSDLSLSLKYNYSVAGIRKIKNRVNDKIKRL